MLSLSVAYGLPASGKTTLLKSLGVSYCDYDTTSKRYKIKEFIESLTTGNYAIDFLLLKPNDFVNYFFRLFPEGMLTIYKFKENRELSLIRDSKRDRKLKSTNFINNMQLEDLKIRKQLVIIEVD